jgi:hypothetical protein
MGFVEVVFGVLFALVFGTGVTLTLSGTLASEFWWARACYVLAALCLVAAYLKWRSKYLQKALASTSLATAIGTLVILSVVSGTPFLWRWVDTRERIAQVQEKARTAADDMASVIQQLSRQSFTDERALAVRDAIVAQWNSIKDTQKQMSEYGHAWPETDRLVTAEHMLNELSIIQRSVGILGYAQGNGSLVLQIAPNTFRITFNQPMARVPTPIIKPAPSGAVAEVEEISKMGAIIVFKPMSSPVSLQDLFVINPAFDAEL